jgi:hypothetical protein
VLPAGYLDAQNVIPSNELRHISREMHSAGVITNQSVKTIGSPFLSEWQRGHIITKEGNKSGKLLLRYNMRKNNVQYTRNKNIYMIPAKKLKGFIIETSDGNIAFKNGFKTDQKHIKPNTLLQVIYNGNVKLLAHHTSTLIKNMATYGTATKKQKFEHHIHYFLQTPDDTFHKVKLKRKDILNALPDHKKEVKRYAKENHLSFKKKADLKKILVHYDSISSSAK